MTLIGRRCTGGDAFSRARLIARTLSGGAFAPRLPSGPVPVPLLSAAIVSADNVIEAATARRLHPFPFRTGQLSSGAPMVLRKRESRSPPSSSLPPFPSPSFSGRRTGRGKGFFVAVPFLFLPAEGNSLDAATDGFGLTPFPNSFPFYRCTALFPFRTVLGFRGCAFCSRSGHSVSVAGYTVPYTSL